MRLLLRATSKDVKKNPAEMPEEDVRIGQRVTKYDFYGNKESISKLQEKTEGRAHIF